jgi:type IV secretion system protein VirB9
VTHTAVLSVLAALALVESAHASAEIMPPRGSTDVRVRAVPYAADQVYRLNGYVGFAIHIQLQEGEEYVGLGAGDAEALTVDVSGSDVFLKPRALLVHTNLTLLTSRRRYHFDYSAGSAAPNPEVDDVIYSLRFTYETTGSSPTEGVASAEVRGVSRNENYWYCGHRTLKPEAAFDDGVHTHVRFSSKSEVPAIFVRNEDGSESLLNFSLDASTGDVVIHRLAPAFVLRRGRMTGCIVNRGYAGSGERLPSGAVTPSVTRELRGLKP